ncbi:MAG: hypothetical protein QXY17_00855 [Candidatus Micrarchaeia archaeon]
MILFHVSNRDHIGRSQKPEYNHTKPASATTTPSLPHQHMTSLLNESTTLL